ncbi:erythronolide synthase [Amycolatopsis sp. WAC 01376]|uniref:type I polyketide synthase n=1 Tax=Amycolatopsis sp. WAC 01376 TaxID=2203195 RepID=UPI000F776AEB|nr:type I polyketide synthase [Amycolatopsis sp. WAC 01376]RSM56197.1 erythronolide synthase [Amycolatopsis sp. WAC 01376]
MSGERISIVGIGLTYPDAGSPTEFWENVLGGRRAFREIPPERLDPDDYWAADPAAPDRHYARRAAVLRDFEFDRVRYRVAGSTFRSTDLTHWLALDVAARALEDAGFPGGAGLPRSTTGVILGNSLTGEFSRANVLRLRWPYVRRTVAAALSADGWDGGAVATFLHKLEAGYKAPFPEIDEDSLAGGLANTIAGRICNHFDLAGGGFVVDGACSSSLLSVATAANALAVGDLDVALVGGVDLSIDPFEVIGFAKTGALATGEMVVYDRGSNGFWPGEGCGIVVLMRERDAVAEGRRIYASLTGWGVSSDGKGGLTRPEAAGHRLALSRAYERAGYGTETVSLFEGHGTGTAVGDATEIEVLSGAHRAAGPATRPAALGTIKGNIGHTKAAAGVAGLIKASLAVHHQVIPPATGHRDPHPLLLEAEAGVYVPVEARPWPENVPMRAGVSAMGFGGINSHVTLEQGPGVHWRGEVDERTRAMVDGRQDAELLLFDADDQAELRTRVDRLAAQATRWAEGELADVAGTLAAGLSGRRLRAAVVASGPQDAARALARLRDRLDDRRRVIEDDVFLDDGTRAPRIAYLFPGQGSGRGGRGAIVRRFASARRIMADAALPENGDQVATEVAQPRIVAGSLATMEVLRELGIEAEVAAGHSLGELTALSWGGSVGARTVLDLATLRGRVMADASEGDGAMAGLATTPDRTERLMAGSGTVIAGYNGPEQTVVSGPSAGVALVCARARAAGVTAIAIRVSHAFHSPAVEPAARALARQLAEVRFGKLDRPVVSTVTGEYLSADTDLRVLLRDQVVLPVRFDEAARKAVAGCDLVVEVGPGQVLTGLVKQIAPETPVLPTDSDGRSLAPLLRVIGAAYVLGAPVEVPALFTGRVVRPFPLDRDPVFLASPCEQAPSIDIEPVVPGLPPSSAVPSDGEASQGGTLDVLRKLAAERVELPLEIVTAETHPLDDLHLSSITVGQLVNDVTRSLGRPPLDGVPGVATARLGELAELIDDLAATDADGHGRQADEVAGVGPWVRAFEVRHVEAPRPDTVSHGRGPGGWTVFASSDSPLAEPLRAALVAAQLGDGVLLCLPAAGGVQVDLYLAAAKAVLAAETTRFVVVQHGRGAAGLAKCLHLEQPASPTTIVELPDVMPPGSETVATVVAEVASTTGFTEVRYDTDGTRTVPVLSGVAGAGSANPPLGPGDVLLVTGGGKGITAECALAMAKDHEVALAIVGRGDPATDPELSGNLRRMAIAGVRCHYERADVTSPEQVHQAIRRLTTELGEITGLLHGAGRNEPVMLTGLTAERFRATLGPKVDGLCAVLGVLDPGKLKLLVTFGSVIGRAGLRGEAHYATANDWLTGLALDFGREHPQVRVLALEWSVWSGGGMGEKLGVIEALKRDGIAPISVDDGIEAFRRLLVDPVPRSALVVTGRAGGLPTLGFEQAEPPLRRFTDRVLVHYPTVELVTEATLGPDSDPYLDDHLLDGNRLFPAVLGMEAMTQVAAALTGSAGPPCLEDVEFVRPIVVGTSGTTTVRIAALARDSSTVDVSIRSEDTGFKTDHFRARLRFPRPDLPRVRGEETGLPPVPVDPADLYGGVLFQGERFRRLTRYRKVAARHAVAEVAAGQVSNWFGSFLPQELVLADPGTRDVMMHAIQCCVPDATLLPQGIDRLWLSTRGAQESGHVVLDARERSQDGDTYAYDLDVYGETGVLVERWVGLRLRAVRRGDGARPWVPSLLGPYLERSVERLLGPGRVIVVEPDDGSGDDSVTARRARTTLAASRALGHEVEVTHRPDGKPEVLGTGLSASHGAGLTLVVTGAPRLGCDVQQVAERSEQEWANLLGDGLLELGRRLASEGGESAGVAGTRLWSALECLRKAGMTTSELVVDAVHADGWTTLSAGDVRIATWVTEVAGARERAVFAVLAGR